MQRRMLAFVFVSLPLAAALATAQARSQSGLELQALNRSVDPCTDFYQFACGEWLANNPVPPDRSSWGRFEEVAERNSATLRTILDAAASGRDPETKKIGDYYASCMDEAAIDKKGAAPLDPELKRIAALTTAADLPAAARRTPHDWRQRVLHFRCGSGFQGREHGHRDCRSGRTRSAGSRLLLPRRCEVGGAAEAVRRARRQDGRARRARDPCVGRHRDADRDRACQGVARPPSPGAI